MWYRAKGKRVVDILLSALIIISLLPLFLCIGLLLFFAQGRPLLFSQVRMGLGFAPFVMYKFRTMRTSTKAEQINFAPGQLDRRTALGKLLRGSKMDELPQLWNVIRGDMSLVGPRPEVPAWVDTQSAVWSKVLSVRPGITDYASIEFMDEEVVLNRAPDPVREYRDVVLPAKLSVAVRYAENVSLSSDVSILYRTLGRLVVR